MIHEQNVIYEVSQVSELRFVQRMGKYKGLKGISAKIYTISRLSRTSTRRMC